MENEVLQEKRLNVYAKLQKARAMLQKRGLNKSGTNKAFNYSYFELQDFIGDINEIFYELGLFSLVNVDSQEGVLTIINTDEIKEQVRFFVPSCNVKGTTEIQSIGSQQTYVKRYLYMLALEIAESDMIDGGEVEVNPKKTNTSKIAGKVAGIKDNELDELLNKVLAKKEDLKKAGKMAEANKAILEKSATPNPKGIKSKEDLQFVLDKLNEIK